MTSATGELPIGFRVRLTRSCQVIDRGRTLLGGSPMRLIRLSRTARTLIVNREVVVTSAQSRTLANIVLEANLANPVFDEASSDAERAAQLTCVIPVFERVTALDRLLASIGSAFEVIVVDDGSRNPQELARVCEQHGAIVVRSSENMGPAHARNLGLSRVTTPFVAFIDSDVVVEPRSLESLVRHFTDPQLATVAPRVRAFRDTARSTWFERYEATHSSLDMGSTGGLVRPQTQLGWVPAATLIARVDALTQTFGGSQVFDESMRAGEDVNLIWKLIEAGWRVRYDPDVSVRHEHRQTMRGWLTRKAVYASSAAPLAQRHPDALAPAVFTPWSAIFVTGLLVQRRWSVGLALGALTWAWGSLARTMSGSERPFRLATRLTLSSANTAFRQTGALLVRHWWPLAVVAAVFSVRARRALAVALVTDTVQGYRRARPRLDPLRYAIARRLDDTAYGAGLWWGVLRQRSVRALIPRIIRRR